MSKAYPRWREAGGERYVVVLVPAAFSTLLWKLMYVDGSGQHLTRFAGFSDPRFRDALSVRIADTSPAPTVPWTTVHHGAYSPVLYIPSAIGIKIAEQFTNLAYAQMIGAVLGNLIGSLFLIAVALVLCPIRRWMLAAIALLPTSFDQMAGIGADSISLAAVNAVCGGVAATGGKRREANKMDRRGMVDRRGRIGWFGEARLCRLCRHAVTIAADAALPRATLAVRCDLRRRTRPGAVLALVGRRPDRSGPRPGHSAPGYPETNGLHIDPAKCLRDRFDRLGDQLRAFVLAAPHRLVDWFNIQMPPWYSDAAAAVLLLLAIMETDRNVGIPGLMRLFAVLVTGVFVVYLCLAEYLFWTPVGSHTIEGLYGRLFLPLLPLACIILPSARTSIRPAIPAVLGIGFMCLSVALTVLANAAFYFDDTLSSAIHG